MANGCRFSQDVIPIDLTTASADDYPEGYRIRAEEWNSYIAAFSAEATVNVRIGTVDSTPYNLYSVPVRRNPAPFGDMWLSWDAQADITLTLILGVDEDAGVR